MTRPLNGAKATGPMLTFTEIGEKLGITRQSAYVAYQNGMEKLSRDPRAQELYEQLQRPLSEDRQHFPLPDIGIN